MIIMYSAHEQLIWNQHYINKYILSYLNFGGFHGSVVGLPLFLEPRPAILEEHVPQSP